MKFFKTIRGRIITLFIVMLLFMQLVIWGFAYTQVKVVSDYAKISDNMITTYNLLSETDSMIKEYAKLLRDSSRDEYYTNIEQNEKTIVEDIDILSTTIADPKSKQTYRGLRNLVLEILEDKRAGVEALNDNDIISAYEYYDAMVKNYSFAQDASARLVFDELAATQALHSTVISDRNMYFVIGAVIITLSSVASLIYSMAFINRTTDPLIRLSRLSDEIARGRYKKRLPQKYLEFESEIGLLTRSLQKMISMLTENIESLAKSNKEILRTKNKLEQSNKDLEAMNKAMIDREIKMIELKKQIEELQKNVKN